MRQLAELGYGRNAAHKAARVGRLHRVHRGVYAVGHRRCMAAVLASYPSVASHLSAAWLWGLLRSRPDRIDITGRGPRHGARPFVVHRSELAPGDRCRVDGIPATSLSWTILDVAITSRRETVGRHIRIADELKVFDLREMHDLLDRTKGHRGQAKVSAALDIYEEDPPFTRSGLERRFLELTREAGLPEPAMLAGIETTRVTGPRLDREPAAVVESVRRHLARRAGRGGATR
ncbi:MAG: hypothetical protein JST08_01780 [Actinobacteria bacterium]|nr:hypothetical protein [Actinomycetota bacterium]